MFPQLFGIKGIRILKRFRSEPFNSKYWALKYLAEEKSNFRITTFTEHPLGNKYFVKRMAMRLPNFLLSSDSFLRMQ